MTVFSAYYIILVITQQEKESMIHKSFYLGQLHYINDGVSMADEFETIAKQDKDAADLL